MAERGRATTRKRKRDERSPARSRSRSASPFRRCNFRHAEPGIGKAQHTKYSMMHHVVAGLGQHDVSKFYEAAEKTVTTAGTFFPLLGLEAGSYAFGKLTSSVKFRAHHEDGLEKQAPKRASAAVMRESTVSVVVRPGGSVTSTTQATSFVAAPEKPAAAAPATKPQLRRSARLRAKATAT